MTMVAPISKSTKIHSFDEPPSQDVEPAIRAQLIEEAELKAQRWLSEALASKPGFSVVPFEEARLLQSELDLARGVLNEEQIKILGTRAQADLVLTGRILDYGAVQPKYWVTGLVLHSVAGLLALGFGTGWNPAVIGAYLAYESPDVLIWSGGAYVVGWAFRPVRLEVTATQLKECAGEMWVDQELMVTVPRKTLRAYPQEDRKRKEVQLEVNLNRAITTLTEHAEEELRLQACTPEGRPAKRKGLPFLSLFGLTH
jgi:hypothetical protein